MKCRKAPAARLFVYRTGGKSADHFFVRKGWGGLSSGMPRAVERPPACWWTGPR